MSHDHKSGDTIHCVPILKRTGVSHRIGTNHIHFQAKHCEKIIKHFTSEWNK